MKYSLLLNISLQLNYILPKMGRYESVKQLLVSLSFLQTSRRNWGESVSFTRSQELTPGGAIPPPDDLVHSADLPSRITCIDGGYEEHEKITARPSPTTTDVPHLLYTNDFLLWLAIFPIHSP